eukprot:Opistho-2@96548
MDTEIEARAQELFSLVAQDLTSLTALDGLFDCIVALTTECQATKPTKDKPAAIFLEQVRDDIEKLKSARMQRSDFETVKVIGKGAFGEVSLVKSKLDGAVYALKRLNKLEMLRQRDTAFFREERDVLVTSRSRWIAELYCSFQDESNLYLILEYLPGGDLFGLISRYERFTEDMARFYMAEIVLAVDAVHELGFIHRDIKPDNMLITGLGHIKLVDFGSCVKMDKNGKVRSATAVGTPDYLSPEVLTSTDGEKSYGREVDWWSVGACLDEMLCDDPAFNSDTRVGTYG